MTTFALVHGASSAGFYWERVAPFLEAVGHAVIAPNLPSSNAEADFIAYADAVDDAIGEAEPTRDLVVVGQSMGGFTAPVVAARHPGSRLILVSPMIPLPGETPADYVETVDLASAQATAAVAGGYDASFDVQRIMLHDVEPETVESLLAQGEPAQAESIFTRPFPLDAWPEATVRVIACTEDRMFPLPLVEQLAHNRLGVQAERLRSGHLPGFGHPEELARLILLEHGQR